MALDWYALFVLTGEEENVVKWLHYFFDNELRAVIPKRKLTERRQGKTERVIKIIFPGYVLVNVKMDLKIYYDYLTKSI
jgi:transcriptional antiterminator NusG